MEKQQIIEYKIISKQLEIHNKLAEKGLAPKILEQNKYGDINIL